MNTNRLFSIALAVALLFAVPGHPAPAQTPINGSKPGDRASRAGDKMSFANLLAQAWPNKRAGFALMPPRRAVAASDSMFTITPVAAAAAVTGSGTPGRLSKWVGTTGANTFVLGDSNIFEDKFGKVGIGTTAPTSRLTVAGVIETTSGGFKFPDGSVQTSSATGALFAVAHDATLVGSGTAGSPLGVAPSFVAAITGEPFQQQVSVTIPNNALQGTATITVPGNKRMIIEFVSAHCELFSPGFLIDRFEITTSLGGQAARYQFAGTRTTTGLIDRYVANQQVVIHADPGSTVIFFVTFPTMLTSGATGRFSIAGRLFDAP
jgi:hypothetical protein